MAEPYEGKTSLRKVASSYFKHLADIRHLSPRFLPPSAGYFTLPKVEEQIHSEGLKVASEPLNTPSEALNTPSEALKVKPEALSFLTEGLKVA